MYLGDSRTFQLSPERECHSTRANVCQTSAALENHLRAAASLRPSRSPAASSISAIGTAISTPLNALTGQVCVDAVSSARHPTPPTPPACEASALARNPWSWEMLVYAAGGDSAVYAMDRRTGELRWRVVARRPAARQLPLVVADVLAKCPVSSGSPPSAIAPWFEAAWFAFRSTIREHPLYPLSHARERGRGGNLVYARDRRGKRPDLRHDRQCRRPVCRPGRVGQRVTRPGRSYARSSFLLLSADPAGRRRCRLGIFAPAVPGRRAAVDRR